MAINSASLVWHEIISLTLPDLFAMSIAEGISLTRTNITHALNNPALVSPNPFKKGTTAAS